MPQGESVAERRELRDGQGQFSSKAKLEKKREVDTSGLKG